MSNSISFWALAIIILICCIVLFAVKNKVVKGISLGMLIISIIYFILTTNYPR